MPRCSISPAPVSRSDELDLAQGDEVDLLIEPDHPVPGDRLAHEANAERLHRRHDALQRVLGIRRTRGATRGPAPAARRPLPRHRRRASGAGDRTASAAASPAAELWWRLRVKDGDGNRTRVVAIVAASREEAIAGALAEIGGGWEILEAEIAPRAPAKKRRAARTRSAASDGRRLRNPRSSMVGALLVSN